VFPSGQTWVPLYNRPWYIGQEALTVTGSSP
jgi:hypothetical protein